MKRLRVGVIGTGSIGEVHLDGYAAGRPHVEIWALCDINEKRLNAMGDKYGVPQQRRYRDYRKMLSNEPVDVVSVCTPNVYHYPHAREALSRGLATLIEKPMVLQLDEARDLIRVARRTGAKAMVAFSHRFVAMNNAAKEIIQKGQLGTPFMIRVRYAHGGPYPGWAQSDWFYKKRLAGGGALLDMGIHAIDICHYFVGPIQAVSAQVRTLRKDIEVDDNAVLLVDFGPKQKCLGYIECGWTSPPGFNGIEIYCDKGTLILDLVKGGVCISGKTSPNGKTQFRSRELKTKSCLSHWPLQMDQWIRYVTGRPVKHQLPTLEDGLRSLQVALAAIQSSRTGCMVRVK